MIHQKSSGDGLIKVLDFGLASLIASAPQELIPNETVEHLDRAKLQKSYDKLSH